MFDPVRLILLLNYYYGRLMGLINFEIDVATGRAKVTRSATIYAAVINILLLSMLPVLVRVKVWSLFYKEMEGFHEYVFVISMFMRIGCVLLTTFNRWWQRHQIVCLLEQFRKLIIEQPQVMQLCRRGVILEFITGLTNETFHMAVLLNGLQNNITLGRTLGVLTMSVLLALLNTTISQSYFAMLNLHGHYVLFNEKLRSILSEVKSLELDQQMEVRMLRSCDLAERLHYLAYLQSDLQSLIQRMLRIFGLQNLCMSVIFYISLVSGLYGSLEFMNSDWKNVSLMSWDLLFLLLGVFSFFANVYITFSITYHLHDQHDELKYQIVQNTSFGPDLDVRLQKTFESFQLQLARTPLKLSVMGLYSLSRVCIATMLNSILTHSLILIQYELENF